MKTSSLTLYLLSSSSWTSIISNAFVTPSAFHTNNKKNEVRRKKYNNNIVPSSQITSSVQTTTSQLNFAFPQELISQEVVETSKNLLQSYGELLREYPITTKSATSAILACIGDAIAQYRAATTATATSTTENNNENKQPKFSYDYKRGIGFLLFGALYTGAFQHVWFNYLNDHICQIGDMLRIWGPATAEPLPVDTVVDLEEWWSYFDIVAQMDNAPSDAALATGKLFMNQFLMVPIAYMPLFFAVTSFLSGQNTQQGIARAKSLYFPLLTRNYFYWLPVQFFQFLVIPPEWQIPFLSSASLVWTVILSSIGGSAQQQQQQQTATVTVGAKTGTVSSTVPEPSVVAVASTTFGTTVSQQQQELDEEQQQLVLASSAADEITDDVSLEDVENALLPEGVKNVVNDRKVAAGAGGFAFGLLASAADEAAIGSAVGSLVGGGAGLGVAMVSAVSAGVGVLAANAAKKRHDEEEESENDDENNFKTEMDIMNKTHLHPYGTSSVDHDVVSSIAHVEQIKANNNNNNNVHENNNQVYYFRELVTSK